MACPLCGDECHCSYAASGAAGAAASSFSEPGSGRVSVLIDPEAYDYSEQQFASSLAQPVAPSGIERAASEEPDWTLVSARVAEKVARVRAERSKPITQTSNDTWREEVAARLEKYRTRRGRPRPQPSLKFDFDNPYLPGDAPAAIPFDAPPAVAAAEPEPPVAAAAAPAPEPPPPAPELRAPEPAKIIEFPRQPVVPPSSEELAEPILDLPRILEAPESVEAEAPLSDITLQTSDDDSASAFDLDLPLQPAAMEQRVFAGVVDGLIVLMASAIFVLIASKLSVQAPDGKAGIALVAALPCLLWAIYEYVFLVHAGGTPGMEMAHIGLATFDGYAVPRAMRRWRALAMMLAGFSLGLGLLWALLDEDTLCWHDRITKTYPVRIPQPSEIQFP